MSKWMMAIVGVVVCLLVVVVHPATTQAGTMLDGTAAQLGWTTTTSNGTVDFKNITKEDPAGNDGRLRGLFICPRETPAVHGD